MQPDLDRHRTLGELIGLTFELFGRHLATFLSLSLIVVAPIVIVVDGGWAGYLTDGGNAHPSFAASAMSTALGALVIPPLVTSLHTVAVQTLARGEEPSVGAVLRAARPRLLAAVGAVALYTLVVVAGIIALVIPGIWFAVRCYFGAQAAVVDQLGPVDALKRSAEVVQGRWWRTFGALLAFGLVVGVPGAILNAILRSIDDGVVFTSAYVLVQAVLISLIAIFGTLLFFDARARRSLPWQGTETADPVAPERPVEPPRI